MTAHEAGLLAFVTDRSRRRLEGLLELGPKRRDDFREAFHQVEFNKRWVSPWTTSTTAGTLAKVGAPSVCFVVSRLAEEDGQEWALEDALRHFWGTDEAAYISCVPGKLGLFAAFKTQHILAR